MPGAGTRGGLREIGDGWAQTVCAAPGDGTEKREQEGEEEMDNYSTYYMLGAVEELPLEQGFFKERYFPTDVMMDVFNTTKVLADYREGSRRMARFVVPRIGSLPVGRQGFSTYELEPA